MNTSQGIQKALFSTFLIACFLWLASSAAALDRPQSSAPTRITKAIDESSLVALRGNTHPLAQTRFDQGQVPASMPANRLVLVLLRSTQQEADLQTWLQSVQDPNSPNFRKFLSPEEFGARFGVGDSDLQTIQTWMSGHGLTVNKVSKSRMAIEFSGSADQVQRAFHTSLHSYLVHGERHWANASDPEIPRALSPVVAGLFALNNFRPKSQSVRGPRGVYDAKTNSITPAYTNTDQYGDYYLYLGPADAATIYNTPTAFNASFYGTAYTGAGVTIGVAGDSNINLTENANYRSTFGLAPNPTTVVVDGNDPGENDDSIEAYLDTQVSGGIAPNANVILYTAADTSFQPGLFLAIQRALDDNQADILNVSFGECEQALGVSGNQQILNLWEQAAAQGISVIVSSGDSGSAGCDDQNAETYATQGLAVNGISSTPYNTSVGGTDFDVLYSNFPTSFTNYVDITNTLPNHRSALGYIPEEPWNDSTHPNIDITQNSANYIFQNIIAGGGGISSVYPVPAWQASVASGSGRNLPDVSLLAGNGFYGALWSICTDQAPTGYADCAAGSTGSNFYLTGIGGTSASAPAFAGMLALVKQKIGSRLGQADYALYELAKSNFSTVFHDVTTGDNAVYCQESSPNCSVIDANDNEFFMSGYNATTGYDQASGLGSVNASALVSNWSNAGLTATTSSLQLNGASSALSITHGQSVAVTGSVTGSNGTPSGLVALVDSLSPATSPNSEGIADFTLANGSVSGTTSSLPGGTYQVSTHYGGDSVFAQSDSNTISVSVAPEGSTTNLKIVGYYDPATGKAATTPYYGFNYILDAQPYGNSASLASPNGTATGTIAFKSGGSPLGSAALNSNGIAELDTAILPGGSDSLTATFAGDGSFQASTSAPSLISIIPSVTTLSAPNPQPFDPFVGANETLSVTLSADSAGAAPTGTVTFEDGSTVLSTVQLTGVGATSTALAGGTAVFSINTLIGGNHNVTAIYSGDSNYSGSTSPMTQIFISWVQTKLVVTPPVTSIIVNQPLSFTATVTQISGLPVPTGSVGVILNNTMMTVPLVNGSAAVTIPPNTFQLGTGNVAVTYSGDSCYVAQPVDMSFTVNSSGTISPTVTITAPATVANYPVSVTVAVSGPNGDPAPTGSIEFSANNFTAQSLQLTNGSASTVLNSDLEYGPNTLTAHYLGDSTYTSGAATAMVNYTTVPYISFVPYKPTISIGQSLTLTVTIATTANVAAPTGQITFSLGTQSSPPIQLTAGSATYTVPANWFSVGTNTVAASYPGDANYQPGVGSDVITVTATPNITIAGTSVNVAPGATTGNTSTVTVTPGNGFTGSVTLTAAITSSPSGAQYPPTLSFGTTSPVILGPNAATATLIISTTAATSASIAPHPHPAVRWYETGGATLACLVLFGIPSRRRSWRRWLGMFAICAVIASGVLACGGGGSSGGSGGGGTSIGGTTAGTYTITVTGTSNFNTATGLVTLTVE